MLVLSRRIDQKICFPGLGISVQILGVKGSNVKVGVDAPIEVRVVREELQNDEDKQAKSPKAPAEKVFHMPKAARHELRNQLNAISIGLHAFKQQVDFGHSEDADQTFDRLVDYLNKICTAGPLASGDETSKPLAKPQNRNLTALLVEDEDNEREMLAGFLRLYGYEVITAADGAEALEYLATHERPDMVLLDMRMPRVDGPEMIRRIRGDEELADLRLFAISGSSPEENGIDEESSQVDFWFPKPLDPRQLVDAMESMQSEQVACPA